MAFLGHQLATEMCAYKLENVCIFGKDVYRYTNANVENGDDTILTTDSKAV